MSPRSLISQIELAASMLFTAILLTSSHSFAQCNNTTLFPTSPVVASAFNDTVVVSNLSTTGQYYQVKNLALNQSYVFAGKAGDFITIRNVYTNAVLGSGAAPYTYAVGSGPDVVNVHINLANPACGTDALPRTTTLACVTCQQVPPKTGINKAIPQATLDLGGELKLGNAARPPQAGMIRWNPDSKDFEGYNGNDWVSLTKSNTAAGLWGLASAATVEESVKFTPSETLSGTISDVSISGDFAVLGTEYNTPNQAFVFVRNSTNWTNQATITASDGTVYDNFGKSVGISGDYVIVGARFADGAVQAQGAAYIFKRNGSDWTQQAKLTASDGQNPDLFGESVSISGDYAIVGAPQDAVGTNANQGSAYVYVRNGSTWTQQAKLIASDGAAGDFFGSSVSISGDYLIVSASNGKIGANVGQGSAYVFVRSGSAWTQQAKLTAADGATADAFGSAVSISGDYVVVGASGDDVAANLDQGSAYVFVRNGATWTQQARLNAVDGAAGNRFGGNVCISGDLALIGTTGSGYVFARNGITWTQQTKLTTSDSGGIGAGAINTEYALLILSTRYVYYYIKN